MLYDGECPFCIHEMRLLSRLDRGGRLAFADIAAPGFDAARYGLGQEEVRRFIHGILPDGTVLRGLEVFRRAYREVDLGWLLAPTGWPVLRPLADAAYLWFARNRVRLGRLLGRSCDTGSCGTDGCSVE
jgi:predicted DCC family thiol-disulfide oxidoreductase YuxK